MSQDTNRTIDPWPVGTRVRVLPDTEHPRRLDGIVGAPGVIVPAGDPKPGSPSWLTPEDPAHRGVQVSGGYIYRLPVARLMLDDLEAR